MENLDNSPKKEDNLHILNRLLKYASYPVAAISGLWVFKKEVDNEAYLNVKRYGGFDDILKELKPKNEANVQQRIGEKVEVEQFLEGAAETRNAYRKAVAGRMGHLGLGNGAGHFQNKWEYINSTGKRTAAIQGATVTGIAIGALLTIVNSKSLIDYFSKDKEPGPER